MLFYSALLLLLILCANASAFQRPPVRRSSNQYWTSFSDVQKIFYFGDSYTKTGFDAEGDQPSSSNPLGNPAYPGRTSSNGPNWVDYLTVRYNDSSIFSYDFAVGGSTVDNSIIKNGYDFVDQLYEDFIPNYGDGETWSSETSLFAVWFGINDVVNSYQADNFTDIQSAVYGRYSFLVGKLYALGARNFLFINVPPLERSPRITGSSAAATRVPLANSATLSFNKYVARVADRVRSRHGDTTVFEIDAHALFNQVIDDWESLEQTKVYKDTTAYCEAYKNGTPLPDTKWDNCTYAANEYLWLNSLHPTSPMHDALASEIANVLGA
ncbi:hypothetical protein EDB81DRAFT_692667 [Dactylonectria macrodidyma]|uniref:Carbohydrate esterase family 16 protein n=1 Tax=Dactylonectria macrodidyma TaxID=307937 RepID=A0A9P9ENU9_9HYPO|nr:hypothetical protein EDB81DRAFT_692667 [Dactylonectria macrodidyma]